MVAGEKRRRRRLAMSSTRYAMVLPPMSSHCISEPCMGFVAGKISHHHCAMNGFLCKFLEFVSPSLLAISIFSWHDAYRLTLFIHCCKKISGFSQAGFMLLVLLVEYFTLSWMKLFQEVSKIVFLMFLPFVDCSLCYHQIYDIVQMLPSRTLNASEVAIENPKHIRGRHCLSDLYVCSNTLWHRVSLLPIKNCENPDEEEKQKDPKIDDKEEGSDLKICGVGPLGMGKWNRY